MTCLNVNLLQTCQVFFVSCKTVYQWLTTYCYFMSDILPPHPHLCQKWCTHTFWSVLAIQKNMPVFWSLFWQQNTTNTKPKWSQPSYGNLPIQIYEEKNKIISQIYHAVSHMFLQLAPIMNLSGIKHSCVSCGDCEISARSQVIHKKYLH